MLYDTVKGFLMNPLDPDQDGTTSVVEWLAFVGLVLILIKIWTMFLNHMWE